MAGFHLTGPGYRTTDKGVLVSAQLCRVVGWAGSSPAMVHFERDGADGMVVEHHDVFVSRMGLRGGENCQRVAARFDAPPAPDEKLKICVAWSHRRCD